MEKRYKKGHFIGLGIAIGLPVGIPIGLIKCGLIPRPFGSETNMFAEQTPFNTPMALPRGSLLLGNIVYGPVLGIIIGLIIGIVMERKKNPNPILPSLDEKKKQKTLSLFLIGLGMVTIAMVTFLYINHQ